jgi:hypothetical protein
MTFDVLQLHIESAPPMNAATRAWSYVSLTMLTGVKIDMKTELALVGLEGKPKRGIEVLDEVPDDASPETAFGRADLEVVTKVSVLSAAVLAKIDWQKTAPRTGFVDAQDFARMARDERVRVMQKSVQANDILTNEEMARRIADGTVGWHHQTKVKWLAPLKHRVPSIYDAYVEHVRGQESERRVVAVLGRK